MSGYRISEAAARTGFSPSTLRYYEDIGLVAPHRTEAGYRLYDDRMIERLGFVARGKRLGLDLEEIGELLSLWDGDRCGPVAERLRALVLEKADDTEARSRELASFAADLRTVVAHLPGGGRAADGPCGSGCACHAGPEPAIACTLDPAETGDRVTDWRRVVAQATSRSPIDGGLRLVFGSGAGLAADVARLAAAEQSCCAFFEFTVRLHAAGTELEVRAPADGQPLVEALFGSGS